nr:reverse transcriptase domain-containing protein [Tanacetum cinerariifolium]
KSPPSSDSEDSRRKRRKRVSSSSSDSSDNEDEETGHWKSRNGYRNQEDKDMSRPWRRQKVDAFTRRISDFSKDKRRRMPAKVKTYDGTELVQQAVAQEHRCIQRVAEGIPPEFYSKEEISGFMNGINNPELIKRLNDRVPQTFDELMKLTRSFIQEEAAAAAQKMQENLDQSGKDPMRSLKH